MSVRSADTERERRRALTALVAAYPAPASPPWPSNRKTQTLDNSSSRYRSSTNNSNGGSSSDSQHLRRDEGKCDATYSYDGATTTTTLDGSDALMGVAEQVLNWSGTGGRREREQRRLDMCASTWKSVESMARTLAAGQSVVSTIVKCYSMPSLGRRSDRGSVARRSGLAATEMMHTSLLSERLAAEGLAIFRRCAQFVRTYLLHHINKWLPVSEGPTTYSSPPLICILLYSCRCSKTQGLKHVQCEVSKYQESTQYSRTVRSAPTRTALATAVVHHPI